MLLQPAHGVVEVLGHLGSIALALQCPPIVVVAGVAAEWEESVGGHRDVAGQRGAARDVGNVRIEPPVLVDHDHSRQRPLGPLRSNQVSAHGAGATRRGILDPASFDAIVAVADLLGLGVARLHRLDDRGDRQSADRELGGAIEELAPADEAVGVAVVEVEQFLGDFTTLVGAFGLHRGSPVAEVVISGRA